MKKLVHMLRKYPLPLLCRRAIFVLRGRVIHLTPKDQVKGAVLLSYITLPFLDTRSETFDAHTNRWECVQMANTFLAEGYAVDVIDFTNTVFVPTKKYTYFVDIGWNMERLAPLLGEECTTLYHITTAHPDFHRKAAEARSTYLYERRGVRLPTDRPLLPSRAIELCDSATMLGNDFTESTYAYAKKAITRIPISTTHLFPDPYQKNIESVRKHFLWFGGAGVIHKGLDLVIEAFAEMPEYTLTIAGKLHDEVDFLRIYARELALPNINLVGFMNPGSPDFKTMCEDTLALIYPSCSEGQAGSVVLCMHAGLIPVVSYESGVTVSDFGITLKENTIAEVVDSVQRLAVLSTEELKQRTANTWQEARTHYTRDQFAHEYRDFVRNLEYKKT